MAFRFIDLADGGRMQVADHNGAVLLSCDGVRVSGRMTGGEAREVALELMAAAERIDPQPPPRPDRGPRAAKGRR